jgi:hypothetical protein
MSRLAEVQRDFLAAVLGEEAPSDAGLATYRRNILGARCGALAAAYPVTLRLVGSAFFEEAARRHASQTPSTCGDLHGYGKGFGPFLAAYPQARGLAYLPDVARLEWAVHECTLAADGRALDAAALGGVPPGSLADLRLELHPAARLVSSAHPILALWEANQPGRDGTPDRLEGPDRVLVRRDGLAVRPVALDAAQWTLATAFARGATLGEACAGLADAERTLAPALARIAALGAIGSFALAAPA